MKTAIGAGLLAHYQLGTTTVCACWKVTLTNGTVLGFTEHDTDILYGGVTYQARGGFMPSNFEAGTRLAVDNLEAVGLLDSSQISAADLAAGVWDYAAVQVFMLNWADATQGIDILMAGHLGVVSQERTTFKAELRGVSNALSQNIGGIYQPACRATLGDARCGVNLAGWTVTGTLTGVSTDGLVLADTGRAEAGPSGGKAISGISKSTTPTVNCVGHGFAVGDVVYIAGVSGMTEINGRFVPIATVATDSFTLDHVDTSGYTTYSSGGTATPQGSAGYFAGGKLTMTSGASNGLAMEVKESAPGVVTLQMQFPLGVAVGDTYSLVAGCGKRFTEDCVTRFANSINFRGEPHVPGMDKIIRVGGA